MAREVTLVDVGLGTVTAVERALLQIGVVATISADPDKVAISRLIIFPVYSAHDSGIRQIVEGAMGEALRMVIRRGDPFLAIDVGMQLLFDGFHRADEAIDGLHILPGICQPISIPKPSVHPGDTRDQNPSVTENTTFSSVSHNTYSKNPSIESREVPGEIQFQSDPLQPTQPTPPTYFQPPPPSISHVQLKVPHVGWNEVEPTGEHFYFSNCEHVVPSLAQDVLWVAHYGPVVIPAAVRRENIFGCQFRPEISQRNGLRFLRSFLLETRT